jgi:hypothetical protein
MLQNNGNPRIPEILVELNILYCGILVVHTVFQNYLLIQVTRLSFNAYYLDDCKYSVECGARNLNNNAKSVHFTL